MQIKNQNFHRMSVMAVAEQKRGDPGTRSPPVNFCFFVSIRHNHPGLYHMPVIPVLAKLRQEADHLEFKVNYRAIPCLNKPSMSRSIIYNLQGKLQAIRVSMV